jgi:hypothetical protein
MSISKERVLAGIVSLSLLWGTPAAGGDNATCGEAEVLVPDGSAHETLEGFPGGGGSESAFRWYRFRVSPDRSYSIVAEDLSRGAYQMVTLTDPTTESCGGPLLSPRDTSAAEPQTVAVDGEGPVGSMRLSFKSALATDVFVGVQAILRTPAPSYTKPIRVRVEETTLFSPMFFTYSGYEAVYRLANTTHQDVSVTLKLLNDAGGTVAAATFTVGANRTGTRSTGASDLNVPDNTIGQVVITHDGPPGAVLADGFMASPLAAAVLPIKITPARQQR